ncbi:MAG: PTS sugar transporter subunit IIB [Pelosinus sp.]|nr:PTS sugar transporter subunit IIB [Pelosinus sp.]
MKKILLVCSAGLSTSVLVAKMEKSARQQGLETKIWAVSTDVMDSNMANADIVLLGPQVRFQLPQMQEKGKIYGIPVAVIPSVEYGLCNGEKVLEFAIEVLHKHEAK